MIAIIDFLNTISLPAAIIIVGVPYVLAQIALGILTGITAFLMERS